MNRFDARSALARARVHPNADFHTLSSAQVEALLTEADALHYRKNRNAPGSRGRMFCQYLQRVASRQP